MEEGALGHRRAGQSGRIGLQGNSRSLGFWAGVPGLFPCPALNTGRASWSLAVIATEGRSFVGLPGLS
jgi:hypothetical protein